MYFKNQDLNNLLNSQGFVVFNLLDESKINSLLQLYASHFENNEPGFYSSSFLENEGKRNALNDRIQTIIQQEIDSFCEPHLSLGACFLTKNHGDDGEMQPHQDWTIVDETVFQSITIWIPLQDVDNSNGALRILPGSHLFSSALRSPTLEDPFKFLHEEIKKDLISITLKKGQAIAFSHALIHASPPNLTDKIRVAATFGFIPEKAKLVFYHKLDASTIEKYQVDVDFFQRYNRQIGQRPVWLKPIEQIEYRQKFETQESYQILKNNYSIQKAMSQYKMMPILKDGSKQHFFEENGYAVLPVLNQNQIEALKSYYNSSPIAKEKHEGFHVSMDNKDKEFCRQTRDFIWDTTLPEMQKHLFDFKPFVASYTAKEPSPRGIVPPHQDWSFAANEELGFCSITCWIALVDTTIDNGALGIIPGTHKLMQNHRPSPSPQAPVPLSKHMFPLFPYTQLIEMKAGEMLLFDNRTFHASPPNLTNETRLAVGIGITQKNANLVHYFLKPDGENNKLLKYNVDADFFLAYDNARLSAMYDHSELIEGYGEPEELPYVFDDWDTITLINTIKQSGVTINLELNERMESLFPQQYQVVNEPEMKEEVENEVVLDNRTFFQKYTPINIYREIKYKFTLK
jgi:ectoine hydroxylase-related dioxygenase (phytanoyl-CoA dioxygenase family)